MPTSPWADMTPAERDAALAELLWGPPEKGFDAEGNYLLCWFYSGGIHYDPPNLQDWPGMGMVVEAMTAKGCDRMVTANHGEPTHVAFVNDSAYGSALSDSEPAATAEAAWKALGGE